MDICVRLTSCTFDHKSLKSLTGIFFCLHKKMMCKHIDTSKSNIDEMKFIKLNCLIMPFDPCFRHIKHLFIQRFLFIYPRSA